MPTIGRLLAAAALGALAIAPGLAPAAEICPAISSITGGTPKTPRLVYGELDGVPYTVLLPTSYTSSSDRYPVLYLMTSFLENENEYISLTDLVAFTEGEPVIVATPYAGAAGWYSDWKDGSFRWESFHIETFIPHIDATFRTIADRTHRAIAGFSFGGFGAMSYAARHPELFGVAGSFSGWVDTMTVRGRAFTGATQGPCNVRVPFAVWGDPVTGEAEWRAHNPSDLAPNLEPLSLYLAARSGLPCPDDPLPDPLVEPIVREMTEHLSAALDAEGIPHILHLEPCGGHYYNYVQRDIHRFWPQMRDVFDSA